MAGRRNCCVPYCYKGDNVVLHGFPHPEKDQERFVVWVKHVGSSISSLEPKFIFKNRKICHEHFEKRFLTWSRKLAHAAIPTLRMPGFQEEDIVMPDIKNINTAADSLQPVAHMVAPTSAEAFLDDKEALKRLLNKLTNEKENCASVALVTTSGAQQLGDAPSTRDPHSNLGIPTPVHRTVLHTEEPMEVIKEESEASEVAACLACLATDARLYDVRACGLQEAFDRLAGAPQFSSLNGVRHLCLACSSELSKYAAFRDRCQRVHDLLATLQEWGPLQMDDIRAIDRDLHKLTRNLTQTDIEILDTTEIEIPISTPIKTEEDDTEIVPVDTNFKELCKESEDSDETISITENKIKDTEMKEIIEQENEPTTLKKRKSLGSSEVSTKVTTIDGNTEDIKRQENKPTALRKRKTLGSSEVSTKVTTIDGNTEDIKRQENKPTALRKRKTLGSSDTEKKNSKAEIKVGDEFYPDYDYEALENELKVKITLLSKDEQKAELEARKLTTNYLKSPHRCEMCGKGYGHIDTLKSHMSVHNHSNRPFECEICHYRFSTQLQYTQHRERHLLKFTCQECGVVSRGSVFARLHFDYSHSGKTYACPDCPRVFARSSLRYNHVRNDHPCLSVACDQCGTTFQTASGLRMHKDKAHPENSLNQRKIVPCPLCYKTFSSNSTVKIHINTVHKNMAEPKRKRNRKEEDKK